MLYTRNKKKTKQEARKSHRKASLNPLSLPVSGNYLHNYHNFCFRLNVMVCNQMLKFHGGAIDWVTIFQPCDDGCFHFYIHLWMELVWVVWKAIWSLAHMRDGHRRNSIKLKLLFNCAEKDYIHFIQKWSKSPCHITGAKTATKEIKDLPFWKG